MEPVKRSNWPGGRMAPGWAKRRLRILRRDCGLCQCPECKGGELRITPANEVHHRIPRADGGTDEDDNLQAINADCHARQTILDRGHKPKVRIGADGYPLPL